MPNAPQRKGSRLRYWRNAGAYASSAFIWPVYPVILAIYVPVWLLSNNRGLFDSTDAIRPILLTTGVALAAFGAFRLVMHDIHKAAFVTAICTVCFFSFGFLRETLPLTSAGSGALVILGTICLGAVLFARKTRKIGPAATKIFNAFAAAMLVLPVLKIASLPFETIGPVRAAPFKVDLQSTAGGERPNIVHIVLDGYSRADVLRDLYGFDNSGFIQSLRSMGFVVPDRTTTAYSQTLVSMNAIFSLDYVNRRVTELAKDHDEEEMRLILNRDMQESPLLNSLRSLGYRLINVEGLYRGVHLENADHLISESDERFGVSYYEKELMRLTPIHRILERLALEDATYTRVRFALDKHGYRKFRTPFFVYNHIVAPHPPFNISADGKWRASLSDMADGGNRLEADAAWYEQYRSGYVEKLRYTNKALLEKVKFLLSDVPDPKIIVLHSDHGGGMMLDMNAKSRTCLKERMSAFLAVYASNRDLASEIPDQINLVNLYRILLHKAFGADTPPLLARSYFSPWVEPAAFEDVTTAELETYGPACAVPRDLIATHR
jgi:hypothetical protein